MMEKWTAETEQTLNDYLAEVERIALNTGDDAAEIVSGLRDHIIRETEDAAGAVVTLDHLRSVLAAAGTPDMIIGVERSGGDQGEANSGSTVPESSPFPAEIKDAKRQAGFSGGCLRLSRIVTVAATILTLALLGVYYFSWTKLVKTSKQHLIHQTREGLQQLANLEEKFKDASIRDDNKDGVADYGSLVELEDFDFDTVQSATRFISYTFTIKVTPGSESTSPAYLITAVPTLSDEDLPVLTIRDTGEITSTVRPENSYLLHENDLGPAPSRVFHVARRSGL